MAELNPYESKILSVLIKSRTSLTTGRVANRSGISWNTADRHLKNMEERGWVRNRSGYWKAVVRFED